jgi:2,4-dichlorophenol 6-monooxygenase
MSNNAWATSFAGTEIARLQTWGTGTVRKAEYEAAKPSQMCNAPQHLFEPQLRRAAEARGADIRFSTELAERSSEWRLVHARQGLNGRLTSLTPNRT